ncbi:MAG: endonuclease MutS2, partial [Anaerolineae bacterium]|nr:endonuclease MutS2 [Anaerolineae bacterium]
MQQKHLSILELPKILEKLAAYASFSASKALALALRPSPYLNEARGWQTETTEADHLLSVQVSIGVGGARDVRPYLVRAGRGMILTALELLEIRQTLIAARQLQRTITRLAEAYPRLADIAQRIEECPGVVSAISQAIDESGEIKDSASSTLARIRRDLGIAHSRLLDRLNRFVTSGQYRQYLQESLVTQRAGRYVIPLKAEFKSRIQGVIHDQSASGATLFIEPLATVELNNKWRQLQLDEEDEIRKILMQLSDLAAGHEEFIGHTVAALADLDLAFAKAKYAQAIEATEPILVGFDRSQPATTAPANQIKSRPSFKLTGARHPLLDPEAVVSIDVVLAEGIQMLVITGPNTGGKTVSLKTIGLLAAMAQAGLHIPAAEGSRLLVFNGIYADIGDEQSIEQSLSTFSAHMTNLVQILEHSDEQSLVILDELGAGTDPIEGSALARSILSRLLDSGVTTFVATHYSELKAFAHTTPGVSNASMEFDPVSLAPTYQLQIGLPGASNAFTIARRLGLSPDIIDKAQGLVGEDAQQVEAMLAEIKAQTLAAQRTRQLAEADREEAEAYTNRLQRKLAEIDEERREILNSARADARREIKAVREQLRALELEAQAALNDSQETVATATSEPVRRVQNQETRLQALETELEDEEVMAATADKAKQKQVLPGGPLRSGDRVFVNQYGTTAEIVSVQNNQAEIQLGRFRATVPLDNLELRDRPVAGIDRSAAVEPTISLVEGEPPGMELDLRGQVVEEALINMDQYLDKAFLARMPTVRIIHGKGSGVLRQAVRQELNHHPMVSSYR